MNCKLNVIIIIPKNIDNIKMTYMTSNYITEIFNTEISQITFNVSSKEMYRGITIVLTPNTRLS